MRPFALGSIEKECPKALEYLDYGKRVFAKLPDQFEFEGETVPVSCHHLCAIVKARFSELVEYHGFYNADGFIKVRRPEDLFNGEHDGNKDMPVDHSWLGTSDQKVTLDMYPVGHSEGPMLVHGFVRQPLKYGTHADFLFLREEKFKREVEVLIRMLDE